MVTATYLVGSGSCALIVWGPDTKIYTWMLENGGFGSCHLA